MLLVLIQAITLAPWSIQAREVPPPVAINDQGSVEAKLKILDDLNDFSMKRLEKATEILVERIHHDLNCLQLYVPSLTESQLKKLTILSRRIENDVTQSVQAPINELKTYLTSNPDFDQEEYARKFMDLQRKTISVTAVISRGSYDYQSKLNPLIRKVLTDEQIRTYESEIKAAHDFYFESSVKTFIAQLDKIVFLKDGEAEVITEAFADPVFREHKEQIAGVRQPPINWSHVSQKLGQERSIQLVNAGAHWPLPMFDSGFLSPSQLQSMFNPRPRVVEPILLQPIKRQ